MSKPKICPFCGGEAVIYERRKLDGSGAFFRYSIGCGNKYCEIRPQTGFWKHKSEAMHSWNRRAKDAIVRCRDCKHSRKDGTQCMLFAAWYPIAGGDEYRKVPADVEPDCFCSWGKAKGEQS